jgi:hypothetical protein
VMRGAGEGTSAALDHPVARPDATEGGTHGHPDRCAHRRTAPAAAVGILGLLFASVGSIIGSGWLFEALNASKEAGPAAIISWALGAVMILLIALVYAELGTMFPLSGGVVRYPHLSFGSTGWITWVAVATTAPIEVEAALQYATKYAAFTEKHTVGGPEVHTLTALGYGVAVVLMALFVVVNYFGIRGTSPTTGSGRRAGTASSPRSPPPASCSPTWASGRASSWPGRPTTPSATCRSR